MNSFLILAAAVISFVYGKNCAQICTAEYMPVCGSNGVTYSNDCQMNGAACSLNQELTKAHDGPCCERACSRIWAPVCGTNGRTYSNACTMSVEVCKIFIASGESVSVDHEGACCPRFCPMKYAPVCGSNGIVYGNECALIIAHCRAQLTGDSVLKVGDGPCLAVQ